jgi:hypothetical protein
MTTEPVGFCNQPAVIVPRLALMADNELVEILYASSEWIIAEVMVALLM